MRNCLICNNEFETNGNKKFCSDECFKINKNLKRKKEPITVSCDFCETPFTQKRKDNKTCSTSCSQKLWVKNNPEKNQERYNGVNAKVRVKLWRENNTDKIKEIRNRYKKKKYDNDPLFKIKENVRNLIYSSFSFKGKKKNTKTETILGCSFYDFKLYLESKFEPWMTWENKGNPKDGIFEQNKTWDIDHIIPISSAETIDDVIRLNHYTNYQPLCTFKNRYVKKNNIK